MKNSIALLSLLCLVLVSCNNSSNSDVEPIVEEVLEGPTDAFLAFYNSSADDIRIEINSSQEKVELSKTRLSKYHHLTKGEQRIVVTNADSGEEILSKTVTLNGGQYYSSFLFKNKQNEYELVLNNDYDETTRQQGSIRSGLEFVVINISKNVPYAGLDIVNSLTYMTANCGANVEHCTVLCHDLRKTWVDNLRFGAPQSIPNAPLSITTNYLQFLPESGGNDPLTVNGFTTSMRDITIDPNGSGNLQTIERPNNLTQKLDFRVIHLLVIQDDPNEENQGGIWGRFFELSENAVSDISFPASDSSN